MSGLLAAVLRRIACAIGRHRFGPVVEAYKSSFDGHPPAGRQACAVCGATRAAWKGDD